MSSVRRPLCTTIFGHVILLSCHRTHRLAEIISFTSLSAPEKRDLALADNSHPSKKLRIDDVVLDKVPSECECQLIRYFDGVSDCFLHSTSPCKFSSEGQHSRLQSRSVETYVLCFLRPAAQATRPLSCGQNAAYRQDRQQWPKWQCTSSSSTQTLRKNHHAADAEVTPFAYSSHSCTDSRL